MYHRTKIVNTRRRIFAIPKCCTFDSNWRFQVILQNMLMQCELRKQKQFSIHAEHFKLKHTTHSCFEVWLCEHDKVLLSFVFGSFNSLHLCGYRINNQIDICQYNLVKFHFIVYYMPNSLYRSNCYVHRKRSSIYTKWNNFASIRMTKFKGK